MTQDENETVSGEEIEACREDISCEFNTFQKIFLGLQHTLAMFGATVLVPILTGLNVSATLFAVGAGTLIFHLFTRGKVPGFLGSSFAFIAPLTLVGELEGLTLRHAQAGIIGAGIVYILVGIIVQLIGPDNVAKIFPPVVTGPIIMVIGLGLAPTGIKMASGHWPVAVITLIVTVIFAVFGRGFLQVIPILLGLIAGYVAAVSAGLINFEIVKEASWVGVPGFTWPLFNWKVFLIVTPAAIVSIVEHIGDVLAIGSTIGRDIRQDPGLDPTLYGGGVATIVSGLLGGPSLTTYGENIGVLALTGVYSTFVVSMGALWAIIFSFIPKIEAGIKVIPDPVIGGVSVLLYGMIAAIGLRTVVDNEVDLTLSRNLIIASIILVLGVGIDDIVVMEGVKMSGMVIAAISGIILHQLLPD
ncbi:MAG: uracil-xanthine permease family protein [bacterium]